MKLIIQLEARPNPLRNLQTASERLRQIARAEIRIGGEKLVGFEVGLTIDQLQRRGFAWDEQRASMRKDGDEFFRSVDGKFRRSRPF